MFNKDLFANIIRKIKNTYSSQEDFSKKSKIGRTYLSQYMNMKLDEPPKPKILEKLANASNGVTSYAELMEVCGYIDLNNNLISNSEKLILTKELQEKNNNLLNDIKITKNLLKNSPKDKWKNIANYMKENNLNSLRILPIYGVIKAGEPSWAEQNIIGHIPFDTSLDNYSEAEEYFYLKVDGESMNQVIKNGDFALIQRQSTAENGDIIVALVNGYDATLKRFKRINEQFVSLEPMSSDPSFESITVDLKTTNFQILGKFVGYFGNYKNK